MFLAFNFLLYCRFKTCRTILKACPPFFLHFEDIFELQASTNSNASGLSDTGPERMKFIQRCKNFWCIFSREQMTLQAQPGPLDNERIAFHPFLAQVKVL